MELTEENLKGRIFNRWEVLRFSHKVGYIKYFVCKCLDCNEEKIVCIQNIIREKSKSCGCKSRVETAYNINKKYNEYKILDNKVHVYINNNKDKIMLCDLEDWELLKQHYWREDPNGYAITTDNYKIIKFHRKILDVDNSKIFVDHINGNRLDNRKTNLRSCSNQENCFNRNKNSNNTSGYKGVYFDKDRSKWRGAIQYNGKSIKSPKRYNTPEEAYEWYIEKSNELFREYSVFKSRKYD